jgi:sec-independent protein translocase protein TatB
MFGIGLPEMIVIFAVALIVVGPDKLPGLARSLAKGMMEMKKTLNQVKESLTQEGEPLDSVQQDLRKTADELRTKMIDADPSAWHPASGPASTLNETDVIEVEPEALADEAEILARSASQTASQPLGQDEQTPHTGDSPPTGEHSPQTPNTAQ